ncbi:MAG: ATP phosphoribosyltransferase [Ferruginibacter sp.]
MIKLKIAIQKSGRMSEKSLALLKACGISLSNGDKKLKTSADNFPVEVLFLRDDDIPQYVEQSVADIGIIGLNEVWEKNKSIEVVEKLGFAACRLSLAIPKDEKYNDISWFEGKKIASSYLHILQKFADENNLNIIIEEIAGSVEIAPGIGLADGIFDIVSTGSTLLMNGLKEVHVVVKSEAALVCSKDLGKEKAEILAQLLFRIRAVNNAAAHKYIMLNAPDNAIDDICKLLPGMKSPTLLPLATDGWHSLHSVVKEDVFWEVIDKLRNLGAEGILVLPIEKMIV